MVVRLLGLVNHLMDFRKVEEGAMQLHLQAIYLKPIVEDVCSNFRSTAELRNIGINLHVDKLRYVAVIDKEAFTQIVNNLLSNAMEFTKSKVDVYLETNGDATIRLRVVDDGPGISESEQQKIFEPFYQVAENRPSDNIGTGLGLMLVKQYVALMAGDIRVSSVVGKGSEFVVELPKSQVEIMQSAYEVESIAEVATEVKVCDSKDERAKILLVDDNVEMLAFLKEIFAATYDVTCASDAKEALTFTKDTQFDIIVSDIMMPEIDGTELCRRLKTDINTSHIPVVLLTAKVENDDVVTGFNSGADLYVTKPFSVAVIKAQINSLLENRNRLRRKLLNDPAAITEIIPRTNIDEVFFSKLKTIVEKNIGNQDFSVDVLAREMAISRTGLFAKVKAVTGMTPNDYIRHQRIHHAAKLIRTTDMLISEVCEAVGFSSRSHFAKYFQSVFNCAPAEYRQG